MKSMIFVLVLATLVVYIEAHGKMVNPPARGSVWRFFPGDAPRSNVDSEWCFQHLFGENNTTRKDHSGRDSTCGVCGPIYGGKPNTPRNITLPNFGSSIVVPGHSYEASTRFGFAKTGKIVKTYKKGQVITTTIHIGAMHGGGPSSFRICSADGLGNKDPSQACFDQNVLKYTNNELSRDLLEGKQGKENYKFGTPDQFYTFYVRLPANLTCEHCVLQWVWGPTTNDNNQEYHGCADVRIIE